MLEFSDLNVWAILVATIVAFALGGLWYGPLFGSAWLSAIGKTADEIANECVLQCYQQGLHLMGPLAGNVLRVSPPLVISESEAKEGLGLMHRAFEEIATAGRT